MVTISVIFLIVLVSLYDYFSARNWQQVTSSTRNDIVFESRNKEYGAYAIRKDYDKKIVFIILGLCVLIGGSYGTYKYIKSLPEVVVEPPKIDITQFDIPAAPPEKEVPPPEEVPPPPTETTIAFIAPVVSDEEQTEEINAPDPEIKTSLTDNKGEPGWNDPDTATAQKVKIVEPEKEPELPTYVDEEANLPSYNAFLAKNLNYPETAVEEGLEGKCYLSFVVDLKGNITNIRVTRGVKGCPECDAEAIRVIKMMPAWTPAKLNGKSIKAPCNAVITYKLQ